MLFTSLTRISDLATVPFDTAELERSSWDTGDYVVAQMLETAHGPAQLELQSGRQTFPMEGDLVVGAFGIRHATLESVGSWREIGDDLTFRALTGAGLFGKETSKSSFSPNLLRLRYAGHVVREGRPVRMKDFVPAAPDAKLTAPMVLIVGTSMSAGKTMSAKVIIRRLKVDLGLKVVGAKLTGAGRYRDVLSMEDAGADAIFDFVDVGLPSTVCPEDEYRDALHRLMSLIAVEQPDVVVAEGGASPLEPYNGEALISEVGHLVKLTVLSASDPYAVVGVMRGFDFEPDLITGIATNTVAALELVSELTGLPALDVVDRGSWPELTQILKASIVA